MSSTSHAIQYLLVESGGCKQIQNFIGGEFRDANSQKWLDSEDPSVGEVWLTLPDSDEADVDLAVTSALSAFNSWSGTSKEHRARLLNKVADIVEANADGLARLESRDQGKTVKMAREIEIPRVIQNFRMFAAAILCHTETYVKFRIGALHKWKLYSGSLDELRSSFQQEPVGAVNFVKSDAVGVAVLISPWNLPLYLVCKPSEMTSATAWLLMHAFKEAGFPDGVVNMLTGTGPRVGEPLISHPKISLISFTGSTAVGRRIGRIAGDHLKKVSLEMGGKNAAIVFPSVDFHEIMAPLIRSCFANQGEICLCTSRLFVHEDIFKQFVEEFVARAKKLVVGNPRQEDVDLGALISRVHHQKVTSFIDLAKAESGVKLLCGGPLGLDGRNQKGYFISPTVITGMADESRLMQEEIFGPVVCVTSFSSVEEVVRRANAINYGLSASVWSKNADELMTTASKLRVGTVWCNCWLVRDLNMPFGGTKESGIGKEGVRDSLHFFTEQKNICLKLTS